MLLTSSPFPTFQYTESISVVTFQQAIYQTVSGRAKFNIPCCNLFAGFSREAC